MCDSSVKSGQSLIRGSHQQDPPFHPSQSIVTASASPFLFASLFMATLQFLAQIHDSIAVTCMHNRHPCFYLFVLVKHTQNMFFGSQTNSEDALHRDCPILYFVNIGGEGHELDGPSREQN